MQSAYGTNNGLTGQKFRLAHNQQRFEVFYVIGFCIAVPCHTMLNLSDMFAMLYNGDDGSIDGPTKFDHD